LIDDNGFKSFNAFEKYYSNATMSVGVSYPINNQIVLKLNAASGFRAPNIAELSANGTHEGTIRYEYGNNQLTPEKSYQADFGMEYTTHHVYFSASLFYNYIHHFIYIHKLLSPNGTDSIPAENNESGYAAYQYQQQNAVTYGGELYLDIHPHPFDWLHLEQTFSYVRGRFANGTQNLPFMPAPQWNITLKAQKPTLNRWLKNAYVKLACNNSFTQNKIFAAYHTETITKGYSLLNFGWGLELCNKKQKTFCSVNFVVQNLLNTAYQNHLNRLKYAPENLATGRPGIYNMGRNISVTVQFPLSF
jgi:iron complex outermembrane receptor protein